MKNIIVLLVTFFFIYPIYPKFLPIPIDRVYQIVGLILILLNPNDLKNIILSRFFLKYLRISVILLLFVLLPLLWVKGSIDLYFFKRALSAILDLFSAYTVYWITRKCFSKASLGIILKYIVLAAILQTAISLLFFLKPAYYDLYYSYLNEEVGNKDFSEMLSLLQVRFIGIGSSFFSGVIKYGVAFFAILILPYVYKGSLTSNKIVYILSLSIIFIGGMLTGRSFLIAIILGVLMITILKSKTFFGFILQNIKLSIISLPALFFVYLVLSSIINASQFERVFNYVFSLFVNYFSGDGFQSSSTNAQLEMYVFPNSILTWLFGDGRMVSLDGGYYMGSDIGYIRLIFYFGLPLTLFFVYVLYKYYRILASAALNKPLTFFFYTIFMWFVILSFKGLVVHNYYSALFLISLILTNKHKKEVLDFNI